MNEHLKVFSRAVKKEVDNSLSGNLKPKNLPTKMSECNHLVGFMEYRIFIYYPKSVLWRGKIPVWHYHNMKYYIREYKEGNVSKFGIGLACHKNFTDEAMTKLKFIPTLEDNRNWSLFYSALNEKAKNKGFENLNDFTKKKGNKSIDDGEIFFDKEFSNFTLGSYDSNIEIEKRATEVARGLIELIENSKEEIDKMLK